MSPDPFHTAALRRAVLDSWASSPTRFREDANAEEDLVLGGYRDRWFVELAQNAADAAERAGIPGRLRVTAADGEVRVANTGAPLDAAGVASLASLRASAKRDGAGVGRFGVGFAAVLALCTEPRVVSAGGGVVFSAARTAAELAGLADLAGLAGLAGLADLAAEVARRDGRVPVLRLAWPTDPGEPPPPHGFDTEVRLPLPATDPAELLDDALAQASDLLLALPALRCVEVAGRELGRRDEGDMAELTVDGRVTACWRLVRRGGTVPPALRAGLAVEERDRAGWTVSWAVPAQGALDGNVLHAPTPTDERLTLPARLFATLPLEPSRRRVRPGPVTDHVLAAAGACYPELVTAVAPERRAALVPLPALPASEVDSALREAVLAALRQARWLAAAGGGEIAPVHAVALDVEPTTALAELLAEVVPGLLAAPWPPWPALAAVGVQRLPLGELVDRLAGLARPPAWWRELYDGLEPLARADGAVREELAALPVPLADGRTVLGPRTAILAPPDRAPAPADRVLTVPGLRVVHPDAAHPLLTLLGAREAGFAELLDDPALREAVERSVADAEAGLDVAPLADAVLALVDRAGHRPWLGALALPDADGEPRRADELVLPDGALRAVLADGGPLGVLDQTLAAAHPRQALIDAGVLDGFAVVVDTDPPGPEHDLADEAVWWATQHEPPARLVAVRDLDLVDPARWPAALALLGADPAARAALARRGGEPAPYTSWWLSRFAVLDGHPPRYWRLPSAAGLAGLFDPAPVDLDERLLTGIGARIGFDVEDPADAADLLDRLADTARAASAAVVRGAHAALAAAVVAGRVAPSEVEPPASVRTLDGGVVDAEDAVVLDRPWLAAVLPAAVIVAGGDPEALADLLDLPLASEQVRGVVSSTGVPTRWTDLPEVVAACEALAIPLPAGTVVRHEELVVRLEQPAPGEHRVPAWVDDAGRVHAADPLRGLLAAHSLRPLPG